MQKESSTQQPPTKTRDEAILVVKRSDIFATHAAWHGLRAEPFHDIAATITAKKEFLPRSVMETDPTYKQIIPYLVFTHQNRYFLMQRQAQASEQRLQNKYSLGIGGHIRQEDIQNNSIFDWAQREFHEEVAYEGTCTIENLGVLNDDTNSVGQVHVGLVLLLKGTSDNIAIKSELKSGQLLTIDEIKPFYNHMESWSQLVMDALIHLG